MQPLIKKNANVLKLDVGPQTGLILADSTKLRQMLLNLLGNAAKFSKDGMIVLKVRRTTADERDWIEFSVQDSGIGMTAEQTAKVFEAFTQADSSTTRKYGGSGLGLSITRMLCESMGGAIRVQSQLGTGSILTMRLPVEVVSTAKPVSSIEALQMSLQAEESHRPSTATPAPGGQC